MKEDEMKYNYLKFSQILDEIDFIFLSLLVLVTYYIFENHFISFILLGFMIFNLLLNSKRFHKIRKELNLT